MSGNVLRNSLLLISACWQLVECLSCPAQPTGSVVLDGTLGTSGPLSGPDYNITADLGKIAGNNLFQSFSQFNLVNGDVATFSGPVNIANILARVTGGGASSIDGTIQSTIQGANLFFINPFGVLFGSHAQVNVSGSFAVTSASYVKLADGGRFDAANPANDVLTAAPVSAFGFLNSTPGAISFQDSSLSVPAGQSFSVIGGNITLSGAILQAPGGRINLISINSPGELALDVTDLDTLPDTSGFSGLGAITVQNDGNGNPSTVNTSDASNGGGQVVIRGGSLLVQNSAIEANALGAMQEKGVDINVTGDLTVDDGGQITANTAGSANGGAINITAGAITLDGGWMVVSGTPQGPAVSGITADAEVGASGNAGNITIITPTLNIQNGARVSAATGGLGNAGTVTVSANSIYIDAQNAQGFNAPVTGIDVSSLEPNMGVGASAGTVIIQPLSGPLSLQIVNGGLISAISGNSGGGGSINIVADSIELDGKTSDLFTGIESGADGFGSAGQGGNIQIQTRALTLADGAQISAQTFSTGGGGNINVNADTIDIQTGSSIQSDTLGLGPGGDVTLTTTTSLILNGLQANGAPGSAEISASNPYGVPGFNAPAGSVTITAPLLEVVNGGRISASVLGSSPGGNITVNAGNLVLGNHSGISASSISAPGGNIAITAKGTIQLSGNSTVSASSRFSDGGNISLTSASLIELRNSEINASAGGNGGNIVVDPQSIVLNSSTISSSAGSGKGGVITLEPASSVYLLDSTLNAQSASGNGGDIVVAGPSGSTAGAPLVTLNQAELDAHAPQGQGGNISIKSKGFLKSGGSFNISGKENGTIDIISGDVDLTGIVAPLRASLLDAESQLQPYCGLKLAGAVSSFLVVGRGGVPLPPSGVLPSLGLPPVDGGW
jgi:filamentous hemagglutinin family protein